MTHVVRLTEERQPMPDGPAEQTVVVTGGSGRLGRSVIDHLRSRYHRVIAVDVAARPGIADSDSFHADLLDTGAAYAVFARFQPEVLVHLAAIAEPFSRTEQVIMRTNLMLASNVLQAAVDARIGSIVVAGSPTVMGYDRSSWEPLYLPLDEAHPVAPGHAYATSKHLTEEMVRSFVRQDGCTSRFAIFRPSFVVAPEEWEGSPIQGGGSILERLNDPRAAGSNLFSYVDARDAASLVDLLIEKIDVIPNGDVFFCTAPDALSVEPIAESLPGLHPGVGIDTARALVGAAPGISSAKAQSLGWMPIHTWRRELRIG